MNPFTDHPDCKELARQVKTKGLDKKAYSDVVDARGNQYVDLVQEGGGLLGIALVGYTWILEKAGIRFFSLAGTSAGAINTMMIAGTVRVGEAVSERILDILSEMDLMSFVDGDRQLKSLLQAYMGDKKWMKFRVFRNSLRIWKALRSNLGLNPGLTFRQWIEEVLAESGIHSLADLETHRAEIPRLYHRETNEAISRKAELKIIVSDITTKSKITFPEMAPLYWAEPRRVNPACFVRASMSIPYFFEPYVVGSIPGAGKQCSPSLQEYPHRPGDPSLQEDPSLPGDPSLTRERANWRKFTGYRGAIPEKVHFVDGGILSNFPISAFHHSTRPAKPTFGARLSTWRAEAPVINGMGDMTGAMISTMRQLHDYDFLLRNRDYKQLICSIDCDAEKDENGKTKFRWLDFNMKPELKVQLFNLGAKRGLEFLEKFNWQEYRTMREDHPLQ